MISAVGDSYGGVACLEGSLESTRSSSIVSADAVLLASATAILQWSNATTGRSRPRAALVAVRLAGNMLQAATGHAVHKTTLSNCDAICKANLTTTSNRAVNLTRVTRGHAIHKSRSGSGTGASATTAMTRPLQKHVSATSCTPAVDAGTSMGVAAFTLMAI